MGGARPAHVHACWLDIHGRIDDEVREPLTTAAERLRLSARGYQRPLRVAQTIADLDGADAITK